MKLAVYTTVYPGTRPYLADWHASVRAQTDTDFDLWIAIDEMSVEDARSVMEVEPDVRWIPAEAGATPAQVREQAWRSLIPHADAVVMVDADDVMRPKRVEHARRHIADHDVHACALRLVDAEGNDLDYVMPPPSHVTPMALPRHNVFGLSNSTYRTSLLEKCLPLPQDITLVDWYVATQAWLHGRDLHIATSVDTEYRQHGDSTLALLPPFTPQGIRQTTKAVDRHFQSARANLPSGARRRRVEAVQEASERVEQFGARVVAEPDCLDAYVSALNQLEPLPLWWACVAHPELEHFWTNASESDASC